MTAEESKKKLLSNLTIRVYPDLARVLDCGRDSAYERVRSGEIPSIRVGRQIRVPTAHLKKMLGIDDGAGGKSAA